MKTLRDKFFKELTRKRDDGVTEFNRSPHNVFEWIKENLDSEWVSDEEIEEKAKQYSKRYEDIHIDVVYHTYIKAYRQALKDFTTN